MQPPFIKKMRSILDVPLPLPRTPTTPTSSAGLANRPASRSSMNASSRSSSSPNSSVTTTSPASSGSSTSMASAKSVATAPYSSLTTCSKMAIEFRRSSPRSATPSSGGGTRNPRSKSQSQLESKSPSSWRRRKVARGALRRKWKELLKRNRKSTTCSQSIICLNFRRRCTSRITSLTLGCIWWVIVRCVTITLHTLTMHGVDSKCDWMILKKFFL